MSLALSMCVLFISFTSLSKLFGLFSACAATVVVLLTSIYALLESNKLDYNIEV